MRNNKIGENKNIILGRSEDCNFSIPLKMMEWHFACFGSSGSGKTVACKAIIEEMARSGILIIAFDPQGDSASLGIEGIFGNQINLNR